MTKRGVQQRSSSRIGLVWFRRDLRLDDNPAWAGATSENDAVIALYVLDDQLLRRAGPFRRARLFAELHALDAGLRARAGRLVVRRGDPIHVLPSEAARAGARTVYWNADVTPYAVARDAAVRTALDVPAATWYGSLVLAPGSVLTREGRLSRVFGAFHGAWTATPWDPWPEPGDAAIVDVAGDELPAAGAGAADPFGGAAGDTVGEAGAHALLERFLAGPADRYADDRDDIAPWTTSRLSAALRFGAISPRRVVEAAGEAEPGPKAFVRQLAWRDWFAHLLAEMPELPRRPMRDEYRDIPWRNDPDEIAAWKEGRTGYPIVDAGMRELAATGWMHNRVRMITASFLVKHLLVDWRIGERHFRHLLVDGDVAQNVGNWQWVAGTGPDAAPYFRVLNPVTQGRAHDPHGAYLRRWVPEIAHLDDETVHEPWRGGGTLFAHPADYPPPIVGLAEGRNRALAAYRLARGSTE